MKYRYIIKGGEYYMEDKNINLLLNHLDLEQLTRCPDDCSKSYEDLKEIKEAVENNNTKPLENL